MNQNQYKAKLTIGELAEQLDFFVRLDPDLPVEFVGDYADTFEIGEVKMDADNPTIVWILQPQPK